MNELTSQSDHVIELKEREMDETNQLLAARRAALSGELSQKELTYQQLGVEIQKLRTRITAINAAIGDTEETSAQGKVEDLGENGPFTPVKEYWKPILQVLVGLGGRGNRTQVIERVGEKMSGVLTPADYGKLPGTGHVRWSNRVAWQASQMRTSETGFIKSGSTRGWWEITEAGRKWLNDNRE